MKRIPVAGPWVTQIEIDLVAKAAREDWYEGAGQATALFERALADYIGVKHAVTLPHCTSALHLSLLALGVGPGDEVILPDVTWIASAAPITYVGAMPVFADIEMDTWCLDPKSVEQLISPRTKAIIAVDLYGGMPDFDALRTVANNHGIPIIEDAAEAIGSSYKGQKAGACGITGTFSFHGSKTLTTGEGGALVTDQTKLYERVLFLRDHGRKPGDVKFQNQEIAYKYKMSSLQAAFGYGQLSRINELVTKKRTIYQWYNERLGSHPAFTLNPEPAQTFNSYWMTTVLVSDSYQCPKEHLMSALREKGIDTRPFFSPLSQLPAYASSPSAQRVELKTNRGSRIARQGLNLPSALCLEESDVDRVCAALLETIATL